MLVHVALPGCPDCQESTTYDHGELWWQRPGSSSSPSHNPSQPTCCHTNHIRRAHTRALPIPCSPTRSAQGAIHWYSCIPRRTVSAPSVTAPRGNVNAWTPSAAFLCTYSLQSSLQKPEIPCGKHFSHLGLDIKIFAIIINKYRSSEDHLHKYPLIHCFLTVSVSICILIAHHSDITCTHQHINNTGVLWCC